MLLRSLETYPDLKIDDFESPYLSGEKLPIDFKINETQKSDAVVEIKVLKGSDVVGRYSCLSGEGTAFDLPVGVYEAVCTVKTNGVVWDQTKITLTITQAQSKITAPAITATYNANTNLVVTLKDASGNALSGMYVSVNFNGIKNMKTDKNGQIKLSTAGFAPKTYSVSLTFAGNDNYAGSTAKSSVKINKATVKLTAAKKTFKKKVKTKKYTVTLKDNRNRALKNVKLTLKIKGKKFTAKTNAKGQATFMIKKFTKKGKHKSTVTFAGDKFYNKMSKNVVITVK